MDRIGRRAIPIFVEKEIQQVKIMCRELGRRGLNSEATRFSQAWFNNPSVKPENILTLLNEERLFSLWIPKWLGGGGFHPFSMMAFQEEMSQLDAGISNIVGAHYFAFGLLMSTLNLKLAAKMTARITQGETDGRPCILAAGITEPNAATDLEDTELLKKASVQTKFIQGRSGGLLTGTKIFISNAPIASHFVTLAFSNMNTPQSSPVVVLVDSSLPGVKTGSIEKKMSQHASVTSSVFFDQVQISEEDIALSEKQFGSAKDYLKFSEVLIHDILAMSRTSVGLMSSFLQMQAYKVAEEELRRETISERTQWELAQMLGSVLRSRSFAWQSLAMHLQKGTLKDISHPWVHSLVKTIPSAIWSKLLSIDKKGQLTQKLRGRRLIQPTSSSTLELSGLGACAKASSSSEAMRSVHRMVSLIGAKSMLRGHALEKILKDLALLEIYEGSTEINWLHFYKCHRQQVDEGFESFGEPI